MKKKLLILPGYFVGLGGLFLITYRTVLAFFSEGKSITIQVNRYGEQYVDIALLVFLWVVCMIGLLYLSPLMNKGGGETVLKGDQRGRKGMTQERLYLNVVQDARTDETTRAGIGAFLEPSKETDQRAYHLDADGNRMVSSDAIKVVQEATKE